MSTLQATVHPSTFHSWLSKGLGRAAIFLQQNDSTPYLNSLLAACLQDIMYDYQCEDSRVPYLWELIQFSGQYDFFRKHLLSHLSAADKCYWEQVFELPERFAEKNDKEMRDAMFSAFQRLGLQKAGTSSARALIDLDGVEGFLFALRSFTNPVDEDDLWMVGSLISDFQDRFGEEKTRESLIRPLDADDILSSILQRFRKQEEQLSHRAVEYPTHLADLRSRKGDNSWTPAFRVWATAATSEEVAAAAQEFLWDSDQEKVLGCLRVFATRRLFPSTLKRILDLTKSDNCFIRRAAIIALRDVHDESVRQHALDLATTEDRFSDAVKLLVSNYLPCDAALFEKLRSKVLRLDDLHSIQQSVTKIAGQQRTPELASCLLLLYEEGPCSHCRGKIVKILIELDELPEPLRRECRFDAESTALRANINETFLAAQIRE